MPSMKIGIIALGLACAVTLGCGAEDVDEDQTSAPVLAMSGIKVTLLRSEGMRIEVDGVTFSNASTLYLVKPNWSGRFYGYENDRGRITKTRIEKTAEVQRAIVPLTSSSGEYRGTQTIELTSLRTLTITTSGTLIAPGMVEHKIAGIFPGWLLGRDYTATMRDRETTSGVLPAIAKSPDLRRSIVSTGFGTLDIDSRHVPIHISASDGANVSLVDYRKNQNAGSEPIFWFGVLQHDVSPGRPFEYSVHITFDPPRPQSIAPAITISKLEPLDKALRPEQREDRVIPTPKKIVWRDENFRIPEGLVVTSIPSERAPASLTRFAEIHLQRTVYGLKPGRKQEEDPILRFRYRRPDAEFFSKPDAYRLDITSQTATVEAATTGGILAACASVGELLRTNEEFAYLRGCLVEDWAAMPFRGVHLFSGHDARDLQLHMLRGVLAPLKFNHIVYQCEYIKWASHPEIWYKEFGMEKEDARAVINTARELGFAITPLINTFGHCEWLFRSRSTRKLADNPDEPFAYDPSNPEVYRLCEDIYNEAIEMFRPAFFHIGHDEITMEGFPHREANKQKGATQLILDDIRYYYDFLKARGIRTMIWGDMFLAPGEAPDATGAPCVDEGKRRRDALPKDIFIADWHYAASASSQKFTSLEIFNKAGFDTVACTWYAPNNILRFAKAAAERVTISPGEKDGRTLGLLQTTWAGYSFDQNSMDRFSDQYAAYVLAAEAAWTGGASELKSIPFDFRKEFARLWNQPSYKIAEAYSFAGGAAAKSGWHVNLSPFATFSITENQEWLGLRDPQTKIPVGPHISTRVAYLFSGDPVLLAGGFEPSGQYPTEIRIPVLDTTAAVAFAVAATFPGAQEPIGEAQIRYQDGTQTELQWVLGRNIFALSDPRATFQSDIVWKDRPGNDPAVAIHEYTIVNAPPQKPMTEILLRSYRRGPGLLLFAATGIK